MTENFPGQPNDAVRDARELEMIDRILGLQAELANTRASAGYHEVKWQLEEIHRSATWRAGRAVLAPVFLVRRIMRRSGRR
jgi:hypothetical protein